MRLRARHVVGPVLAVFAVVYFAYHLVHGERGLLAWWELNKQVSEAKLELSQVSEQRQSLEKRVRHLNPGTLDPDLLEERARLMLNYGRETDMVIFIR